MQLLFEVPATSNDCLLCNWLAMQVGRRWGKYTIEMHLQHFANESHKWIEEICMNLMSLIRSSLSYVCKNHTWIVDLNANIIWNWESSLLWVPRKNELSWAESLKSPCESQWIVNRKNDESVHLCYNRWMKAYKYNGFKNQNLLTFIPMTLTKLIQVTKIINNNYFRDAGQSKCSSQHISF